MDDADLSRADGGEESQASEPDAPAPARVDAAAPDFLAPERYKVQFTATAEYVRLVDEARALLSHAAPRVTLEELHLRAMRALVSELTKQKYGAKGDAIPRETRSKSTNARETRSKSTSALGARSVPPHPRQRGRHIPTAVRRAVFERDRNQCTYVAATGERCAETCLLELHHLTPFSAGGEHDATNLALRCSAHNALAAEEDLGREFVEGKKRSSVHEPARGQDPSTRPA